MFVNTQDSFVAALRLTRMLFYIEPNAHAISNVNVIKDNDLIFFSKISSREWQRLGPKKSKICPDNGNDLKVYSKDL